MPIARLLAFVRDQITPILSNEREMKSMSRCLVMALIVLSSGVCQADEGMWLLPLLEKLNIGTMTEMGLELTAEEIYSVNQSSLKDAVVIFGGGCTAEIVSDKGLLLTNHQRLLQLLLCSLEQLGLSYLYHEMDQ